MAKNSLHPIVDALRQAQSVLITTHVHPDGDAVGSLLAAGELLRLMGKRVVCAMADPVPRVYQWLPGSASVRTADRCEGPFDLVLLVDVGQTDRVGIIAERITPQSRLAIVDHHVADHNADPLVFVDASYAATGELMVELFEAAGVEMTEAAAINAYVALITDTGGFRFSNTNARSHRIAARLVETGIDVAEISGRVFDSMQPSKFALLASILPRVMFQENGQLAYAEVRQADLDAVGAMGEDFDGIINFSRNVDGVEVALLLRESPEGTVKISCRSRSTVDCAALMSEFGGGGHRRAAGATVRLSLADARERVLERATAMLRGAE